VAVRRRARLRQAEQAEAVEERAVFLSAEALATALVAEVSMALGVAPFAAESPASPRRQRLADFESDLTGQAQAVEHCDRRAGLRSAVPRASIGEPQVPFLLLGFRGNLSNRIPEPRMVPRLVSCSGSDLRLRHGRCRTRRRMPAEIVAQPHAAFRQLAPALPRARPREQWEPQAFPFSLVLRKLVLRKRNVARLLVRILRPDQASVAGPPLGA
jgi:hypothetical protein